MSNFTSPPRAMPWAKVNVGLWPTKKRADNNKNDDGMKNSISFRLLFFCQRLIIIHR